MFLKRLASFFLTPSAPIKTLAANAALRGRHRGERCFILATGPSVRKQNLKPLREEHCVALSNFFVHPDFKMIRPRYYCVAPYHPPATEQAWQVWMKELSEAIGDATLFFGLQDKERVEKNGFFSKDRVHYLQYGAAPETLLRNGVNIERPLLNPQTIPIAAIQLAIDLGFQEIILLGCDHDWILHFGKSAHFYEEHQHPLVEAGYNEWQGVDMETELDAELKLWRQYKVLRAIAESRAIRIVNATEGGLLDVFPRTRLEDLVHEKILVK